MRMQYAGPLLTYTPSSKRSEPWPLPGMTQMPGPTCLETCCLLARRCGFRTKTRCHVSRPVSPGSACPFRPKSRNSACQCSWERQESKASGAPKMPRISQPPLPPTAGTAGARGCAPPASAAVWLLVSKTMCQSGGNSQHPRCERLSWKGCGPSGADVRGADMGSGGERSGGETRRGIAQLAARRTQPGTKLLDGGFCAVVVCGLLLRRATPLPARPHGRRPSAQRAASFRKRKRTPPRQPQKRSTRGQARGRELVFVFCPRW
jgi:hypothetical protein